MLVPVGLLASLVGVVLVLMRILRALFGKKDEQRQRSGQRECVMTDRVRPYLFYDVAVSICSTCYQKVEAKIVFEDGKVFLLKHCPEHGHERVLIADDVDYYRRCREVFIKPPEMPQHYNTPVQVGLSVRLRALHRSRAALVRRSVEIADSCNLRCPVCYAGSGPDRAVVPHPRRRSSACSTPSCATKASRTSCRSRAASRRSIRTSSRCSIARRQRPIRHLMVNTNGVRIAESEAFTERLATYMPDFEVYLQFDSFEREALIELRGVDLRAVRSGRSSA